MSNLFDPSAKVTKELKNQAFIKPFLHSKIVTYELLKLLKINFENIKKILISNIGLFHDDDVEQLQKKDILIEYLQELEFIEKILINLMSQEKTFTNNGLPISLYQYLDKLL